MGWWSPPENNEIVVGDEIFDTTYQYLDDIKALYQKALSRNLQVDEFQYFLKLALRVYGEEKIFQDFEEKEIINIAIKTKKRPKKQRVKQGDIFAIPLDETYYGFGRIVNIYNGWNMIEVYKFVSKRPVYSKNITDSGVLIFPLLIGGLWYFQEWTWIVVSSDSGYHCDKLKDLRYVSGCSGSYVKFHVNDVGPEEAISDEEAQNYPEHIIYSDELLHKIIIEKYKDAKLI